MMAFAMGSLGWSERQFWCTTLRAFTNAANGYYEEKKLQETWIRRQTMLIYWSLGGKSSAETIWPIDREKDEGLEARLRQRLKEHRERRAAIHAQA